MFYIAKFSAFLLKPFIWLLISLFFIWRTKNAKKKKYLIFIWIIFVFGFTNSFVVKKCIERFEMPYRPISKDKVYDCAVVLSGASVYDSFSQRLQFNESAERITEPLLLYKKKIIKKLLISGGSAQVFPPYQKEAFYIRKFWLEMGVSPSDIIIETESRNTSENAKYVKIILDKNPELKNVLLITSALHMPRSKYLFSQYGIACDYYPVDFLILRKDERISIGDYFLPSAKALTLWENIIHEWVGLIMAKI
ncbi:MAG: YdcF family protein [Bacteroidetes bacterium]|nr:YdcF family protein [Bacteroidota bacterium]